jgi:hypothetical protein
VIVKVKQNSPGLLPPSWPTKSISTNPGTASSQSAQVRTGIWDFNNGTGLGVRPPPRHHLGPLPGQSPVDRGRVHRDQQSRLVVAQVKLANAAQDRH